MTTTAQKTFDHPYLTRTLIRKVPEITILFWVVKLMTTALGESASDFLVNHISPYVAVVIGGIGFVIAIGWQLSARQYGKWRYWLTVIMVALFGTMVADVIHIGLGVPYAVSVGFFAVMLAIVFIAWYLSEKTLSIHSIVTRRKELFYWATVVTTFALGTALGDLTASTFGLGYFASAILFIALLGVPLVAYRVFQVNEVPAFWFAYIVTRPIGASLADWTGRSPDAGGIGLGTGPVSLILIVLIVIVLWVSQNRKGA